MLKSQSDSVESEDFVIHVLKWLESEVEFSFLKSTSAKRHLKKMTKYEKIKGDSTRL